MIKKIVACKVNVLPSCHKLRISNLVKLFKEAFPSVIVALGEITKLVINLHPSKQIDLNHLDWNANIFHTLYNCNLGLDNR